jgi:FkbM family methyltransferase
MVYYGQFKNPSVDEYLYLTFFKDSGPGFFIECGAYDGVLDSSCLFFEKELKWKGINIESDPGLCSLLNKNRVGSLNLNLALTDQNNSCKLLSFQSTISKQDGTLVGHGYVESITPEIYKNMPSKTSISLKTSTHLVEGISIRDLVLKYNLTHIDLLVLDIEGAEHTVLKDLHLSPTLPRVLCIEDNLDCKALFDGVLCPIGYEFISKIHVNLHYKLKGQ